MSNDKYLFSVNLGLTLQKWRSLKDTQKKLVDV